MGSKRLDLYGSKGLLVTVAATGWGWPALIFATSGAWDAAGGRTLHAVIELAVAAVTAWLSAPHVRRVLRDPFWSCRADLLRAVQRLPLSTPCLARESHIILFRDVSRKPVGLRCTIITRMDEGDAQEFAEQGAALILGTTFTVTPTSLRVVQKTGGEQFVTGDDGEVAIAEAPPRSRRERFRGNVTLLRMLGKGAMYAECSELRELTALAMVAEPIDELPEY
jgi:hypothetical protein